MEKPELSLKDLCNEIEAASFSVKMRGYAPEEVDDFMDKIVEKLKVAEEKLKELERYEQWLREDVHRQVMEKAQEEARQTLEQAQIEARQILMQARAEAQQTLQEAQSQSRTMLQTAQPLALGEQSRFAAPIQPAYPAERVERRPVVDQELNEMQQAVTAYRQQVTQALETALTAIRELQQTTVQQNTMQPLPRHGEGVPRLSATPAPAYTVPIQPQPTLSPAPSGSDIERMLEELRRKL